MTHAASAQSESTEKLRVLCNGFHLTMKEKQLLESGGDLTDRIINAACSLLKKQFQDCRQPYYNKVVEHSLNATMQSKSYIYLIESIGL